MDTVNLAGIANCHCAGEKQLLHNYWDTVLLHSYTFYRRVIYTRGTGGVSCPSLKKYWFLKVTKWLWCYQKKKINKTQQIQPKTPSPPSYMVAVFEGAGPALQGAECLWLGQHRDPRVHTPGTELGAGRSGHSTSLSSGSSQAHGGVLGVSCAGPGIRLDDPDGSFQPSILHGRALALHWRHQVRSVRVPGPEEQRPARRTLQWPWRKLTPTETSYNMGICDERGPGAESSARARAARLLVLVEQRHAGESPGAGFALVLLYI